MYKTIRIKKGLIESRKKSKKNATLSSSIFLHILPQGIFILLVKIFGTLKYFQNELIRISVNR